MKIETTEPEDNDFSSVRYLCISQIYNPAFGLTTNIEGAFDTESEARAEAHKLKNMDPANVVSRVYKAENTKVFELL